MDSAFATFMSRITDPAEIFDIPSLEDEFNEVLTLAIFAKGPEQMRVCLHDNKLTENGYFSVESNGSGRWISWKTYDCTEIGFYRAYWDAKCWYGENLTPEDQPGVEWFSDLIARRA